MISDIKLTRRLFHQYPELAMKEYWTTYMICSFLQENSIKFLFGSELYDLLNNLSEIHALKDDHYSEVVNKIGQNPILEKMRYGMTGAIAIIDTHKEGPVWCFRVDIDGLPIKETTDEEHFPISENFASTNSNMHACGHDGHIAIGLHLAKILKEKSSLLKGKYYVIFQPAEEGGKGGQVFSKLDFLNSVNYFIALHVGLLDKDILIPGVSFVANNSFSVKYSGSSAHAGAEPEKGNNTLHAACSAVMNLYGISRSSVGLSRINIGNFHSNNPTNVISADTTFDFEIRSDNNQVIEYLKKRASMIIENTAEMYNLKCQIIPRHHTITAKNSSKLSFMIIEAAKITTSSFKYEIGAPLLISGSEDATFIMEKVTSSGGDSCYVGFSSYIKGGHHNPSFDFNENVLDYSIDLLFNLVKST